MIPQGSTWALGPDCFLSASRPERRNSVLLRADRQPDALCAQIFTDPPVKGTRVLPKHSSDVGSAGSAESLAVLVHIQRHLPDEVAVPKDHATTATGTIR